MADGADNNPDPFNEPHELLKNIKPPVPVKRMTMHERIEGIKRQIQEEFDRQQQIRRRLTTLLVLLGAVSLLLACVVLFSMFKRAPEPTPLQTRIDQISKVQSNLKELEGFLETQKSDLKAQTETLAELNKENSTLAPIVSQNKDQVAAIVAQVNKPNWTDRSISFILGVICSLIAAAIWDYGKLILSKRRETEAKKRPVDEPPPAAQGTAT